jgi:lipid II:glycine glycyltransferase (peptidoglycan interpeptide bridge formation enzyme)
MSLKLSINEINEKKINDFLESNPRSNIFQTPDMYYVYEETKNYEPLFFTYKDGNEIVGILLAVIQKEHSGLLGNLSARSIIWGGPLIKNNNLELLNLILSLYKKKIKRKAIYSQFRNLWEWTNVEKKIFKNNGFDYEDHLDIIHDISLNPENQLMKMHKGRRKNFRRATRKKVRFGEIKNENEIIHSISLIKNTYQNNRLPVPDKSLFLAAYKKLYKKDLIKFFKAEINNIIIGTRYVLCYKNLIYDWYAGSDNEYLSCYPNDFLPFKVMEWGYNNNFKEFDFGGAGKPNEKYGVRDFKLKFGGEVVNWGRFENIHKSLIMKFSKLGLSLWRRIIK